MGKPLVRFCEGQGYNRDRDEILWHRRESRRQTEKTNLVLSHGSPLPTRKDGVPKGFEKATDTEHRIPACRDC